MGVADAKSETSDTAMEMLEGGIRALVRRDRLAVAAELVAEPCEDALIAGATSIAEASDDCSLCPSCEDRIGLSHDHRRKLGHMAQLRDG